MSDLIEENTSRMGINNSLKSTKINHGNHHGLILKMVSEQDILIRIDDLIDMISGKEGICSENMAKLINAMGCVNDKYQSTSAFAADELTDKGKQFIEDINFFINNKQ